jgi:hypothetical protein
LKNKKLDEAMKDVFPNYRIEDVLVLVISMDKNFIFKSGTPLHVAREHAIDYEWIDENKLKELDDDDMWSDGFLDEKTRKFIDEWPVDVCSTN